MDKTNKKKRGCLTSLPVICFSFFFCFPLAIVLMIVRGVSENKEKHLQKDKKSCRNVILTGGERNILKIAMMASITTDRVKLAVQELIEDGELEGAFIDESKGEVVLPFSLQRTSAPTASKPENSALKMASEEYSQDNVSEEDFECEEAEQTPMPVRAQAPQPRPAVTQPHGVSIAPMLPEDEKYSFPWRDLFYNTFFFFGLTFLTFAIFYVLIGNGLPALFWVLFYVIGTPISFIQDKNRYFCKKCKRRFDFDDDVEYHQMGHKIKTYNFNPNNNSDKQVRSRETFKLRVGCHCPACGNVQYYNASYPGRTTYYNGYIKDEEPEHIIEEEFKNRNKGRKFAIFGGFVCVVLAILALTFLPKWVSGNSVNASSSDDPNNYAGIYYGLDEEGIEYILTLNSQEKSYVLETKTMLGGGEKIEGEYSYKNADDMSKEIVKHTTRAYKGKAALILQDSQNEGKIYVFWMTQSNSKTTFESDKADVILSQDRVVRPDPKDYYGTYRVDENNELRITRNTAMILYKGKTQTACDAIIYFENRKQINKHFTTTYYEEGTEMIAAKKQGESTYLHLWIVRDGRGEVCEIITTTDGGKISTWVKDK